MAYNKIALIGIGNITFHDEGLGAYLVKYIENNYNIPDNLTIAEGVKLGFSLITYYQEFDKVIVVCTSSKEGEVGSIYTQSSEEVMGLNITDQTANEVERSTLFEEMGKVQLISMVPENIMEVRNGLTDSVLSHMPKLLEYTLNELKNFGISLNRTFCRTTSFETIIDTCAN